MPSLREDQSLEGVEEARTDHTTGRVELTYDADKVTDKALREAVEESGYTLQR